MDHSFWTVPGTIQNCHYLSINSTYQKPISLTSILDTISYPYNGYISHHYATDIPNTAAYYIMTTLYGLLALRDTLTYCSPPMRLWQHVIHLNIWSVSHIHPVLMSHHLIVGDEWAVVVLMMVLPIPQRHHHHHHQPLSSRFSLTPVGAGVAVPSVMTLGNMQDMVQVAYLSCHKCMTYVRFIVTLYGQI